MPRRGENIYKRKDGRWEGRVLQGYDSFTNKAKYRSVYAPTYKMLKEKLRAMQMEMPVFPSALPAFVQSPVPGCSIQTVRYGDWLWKWFQEYRQPDISCKESTYAIYSGIIQNHIIPVLGTIPLTQINSSLLNDFFYSKLKNGRLDGHGGLSLKTTTDIYSIINLSLCQAQRNGLIHENPCKNVIIPKRRMPETHAFTKQEQSCLESVLINEVHPLSLSIWIGLYTGMRLGEIAGLRWIDINLTDNCIHVRHTLQRIMNVYQAEPQNYKTKIILGIPKTETSIRTIPIPNMIGHLLNQLVHAAPDHCLPPDQFVICKNDGSFYEPRAYQRYFKKIARKAELEHFNFHCLRHTFATRAIELGMDPKTLSELLGHAHVETTLRRYVHSQNEHKRNEMKKLEGVLSSPDHFYNREPS
ncbi:site-specific integrase [Anaerolentibacter hominis]|uniref:tyrosine-type recombinase/integrase n=1 Tax=Anaerolentibacter hominis TaxID=3079009 RepID=UPI0031B87AEB